MIKTRNFLLFILAIALISSLLGFATSADSGKLVISEDYTTITYNGNEYVYLSEAYIGGADETFISDSELALTDEQQAEISSITVYACEDVYIRLSISFKKGGYLENGYLNVDHIDEYEYFLTKGGEKYVFYNYENHMEIWADRAEIFNSPVKVKSFEIYYYEAFSSVDTISADGYFSIYSGDILFDHNGNYYYYDRLAEPDGDYVTLWRLDPALLSAEDDIGIDIDADNGVVTAISAIVLSLFLSAIPLAALIACLILSFKANQPYRRGLRAAAVICAVEIIAFVVTMILLLI